MNNAVQVEGLKCFPTTCKPTTCFTFGSQSTCDGLNHQFEIIAIENPNARKIKSGDTVALRSKANPAKWLDCTSADRTCSITICSSPYPNFIYDYSSALTTCDAHIFEIFGVRRRLGRLLNSNHNIQLQYGNEFLSCAGTAGSVCKLSNSTAQSFGLEVMP